MTLTESELDHIAFIVAESAIEDYNNLQENSLDDHLSDILENPEELIIEAISYSLVELDNSQVPLIVDDIKQRLGIIFGFAYVDIDMSRARRQLLKQRKAAARKTKPKKKEVNAMLMAALARRPRRSPQSCG